MTPPPSSVRGRNSAPSRDDAARDRLSALLTDSGLSIGQLARVLGRDERSMRRWLSAEQAIPETLAGLLARVVFLEIRRQRVTMVVER